MMRWMYRSRQGWLVVGTGLALLGGGDGSWAGRAASAPLDSPPAAVAPAIEAGRLGSAIPRSPVDGMPLAPGGAASAMPVVLPEEESAPMPGR